VNTEKNAHLRRQWHLQLFEADWPAFLVDIFLAVTKRFAVQLKRLRNKPTSISFCGQYRDLLVRSSGQPAWAITFHCPKDHRPDFEQNVFILSAFEMAAYPARWLTMCGARTRFFLRP